MGNFSDDRPLTEKPLLATVVTLGLIAAVAFVAGWAITRGKKAA